MRRQPAGDKNRAGIRAGVGLIIEFGSRNAGTAAEAADARRAAWEYGADGRRSGQVWPGEVAVALGWPLPSASRQPWDSAGYSSPDGLSGREIGPLGPCVNRRACGPNPVREAWGISRPATQLKEHGSQNLGDQSLKRMHKYISNNIKLVSLIFICENVFIVFI